MSMNEERYKAMDELVKGSFSFSLNMNDTFGFATADAEEMSSYDFERMVPIIAQHGQHALTAYVAVKRGTEPIMCPCGHDGLPYQEAKKLVEELKRQHQHFMKE